MERPRRAVHHVAEVRVFFLCTCANVTDVVTSPVRCSCCLLLTISEDLVGTLDKAVAGAFSGAHGGAGGGDGDGEVSPPGRPSHVNALLDILGAVPRPFGNEDLTMLRALLDYTRLPACVPCSCLPRVYVASSRCWRFCACACVSARPLRPFCCALSPPAARSRTSCRQRSAS